jgi:hypothetical protein
MHNLSSIMRDILKDGALQIEEAFEHPEDDWLPVMALMPEQEEGHPVLLQLDPKYFDNETTKDMLVADVMVPAIAGVGAKSVGTVLSAWSSVATEEQRESGNIPRPSQAENRVEVLIITVIDALSVNTSVAEIQRTTDGPPTLSEWDDTQADSMTGRFIDEIQNALRDSDRKQSAEFMQKLIDDYGQGEKEL